MKEDLLSGQSSSRGLKTTEDIIAQGILGHLGTVSEWETATRGGHGEKMVVKRHSSSRELRKEWMQ